ncbi:MAG: hypothetical protein JXR51_14385 [Bacteroidales bacterium]|nr:hypothetical protein [Bacteroidales bacterium]
MNKELSIAPKSISDISSPTKLTKIFESLINQSFVLTGKTRTDGANIRKLISKVLIDNGLPDAASIDDYKIVPPKKKGVPKLLRELIDTYIVTSGNSYNLQVWNRFPNSQSTLIEYSDGSKVRTKDIRYVFVKIDTNNNLIESVLILSPDYIVNAFGKFGKPTIKHQLLVSQRIREGIINQAEPILIEPDTAKVKKIATSRNIILKTGFNNPPTKNQIFSIEKLKTIISKNLIGFKIKADTTKNRGQALEEKCLLLLGYEKDTNSLLEGGYPDIRNQLLEIKIQDAQTIDLGKYSPEFEEIINDELQLTTKDVRYLIALTDKDDLIIKGIILMPGEALEKHFTYVSDTSFKCQRAIPMSFFQKYIGRSITNPK